MRTTSIVILAIVLFASTNALTAQDIIRAVNFARKYPKIVSERIAKKYAGKTGPAHDPTCYTDAINFLSVQPSLKPLVENIGADLAAYKHSKYIVKNLNQISHTGEGGSSVKERILAVGQWIACWGYSENIAATFRQDAAFISADEFVEMWIIDEGLQPGRGHRFNMFDVKMTSQGCGVYQGPMKPNGVSYTGTVVTCIGVKGYSIGPIGIAQLPEAGLTMAKNGVRFTGV